MVNDENFENNFNENEELNGSMESIGKKIDRLARGRSNGDYAQRIGIMLDELNFVLMNCLTELEKTEIEEEEKATQILPIFLN